MPGSCKPLALPRSTSAGGGTGLTRSHRGDQSLQFCRPMRASVLCANPLGGALANDAKFMVTEVAQVVHDIGSACGQQNFLSGCEECIETWPTIGRDGGAASCGFEQPHRRRIAGQYHVPARDIQCDARRRIEMRMPARIHMNNALHIHRPAELLWILRASDDESGARQLARRFTQ